jgi:hypothetical protein
MGRELRGHEAVRLRPVFLTIPPVQPYNIVSNILERCNYMYKKVDTNLDFVDREKETAKFWKENNIFQKSIDQREGCPTYMFYDGPPTANGKPHIGHVLTVPLRVIGIFTDTTISPSSWLRQCPDRYTIRAGRNLPDKEFRYLRTVIVTAAVYWGFS